MIKRNPGLIKYLTAISVMALTVTISACGKAEDTSSAESPSETPTETVVQQEVTKSDQYRELYAEYTKLLDEYSYYREVSLSGGMFNDLYAIDESEMDLESVKERMINGEEKDTDNSALPATGYEDYKPLDTYSVDIPEVAEAELDEMIEILTKRNTFLTGEIAYIKNDILGNISDANPKELLGAPSEEEMSKYVREAAAKKIKEAENIEEMLKLGGWTILSGSGNVITARVNTGEDTYTIETSEDTIRISSENIWGERSSLFASGALSGIKEAVAYMVTNGPMSIYTAGDFGLWWSY